MAAAAGHLLYLPVLVGGKPAPGGPGKLISVNRSAKRIPPSGKPVEIPSPYLYNNNEWFIYVKYNRKKINLSNATAFYKEI